MRNEALGDCPDFRVNENGTVPFCCVKSPRPTKNPVCCSKSWFGEDSSSFCRQANSSDVAAPQLAMPRKLLARTRRYDGRRDGNVLGLHETNRDDGPRPQRPKNLLHRGQKDKSVCVSWRNPFVSKSCGGDFIYPLKHSSCQSASRLHNLLIYNHLWKQTVFWKKTDCSHCYNDFCKIDYRIVKQVVGRPNYRQFLYI